MKTGNRSNWRGFTFMEVLVIVAVFAVIIAVLLPAMHRPRVTSCRINCISNLKQIGVGFKLYTTDHEGDFPKFDKIDEAWTYFQAAGYDMGSPRVLICPKDSQRFNRKVRALDFEDTDSTNNFAHPMHSNAALSYFYGVDAHDSNPNLLLAGDRNISTNGQILTGVLIAATNAPLNWTRQIHTNAGNILLTDGSAHQLTSERFRTMLESAGLESQRLILP